jgi:adenosylcobinamide kinase/adenosylcobinamide-phosphate guanylyltransferase
VDCLTLWLSNLLLADADLDAAGLALCEAAAAVRGRIIFVSNEVGFGIVPDNALARRFRDAAGRLNQRVAATCEAVDLVVAGIPLVVKG